jgi:hypothetical protein
MAATAVNTLGGDSLFKTVFSGMVLREFEARRVFAPLVMSRQVTRGKAVDFSLMGTVTPGYHTAGQNILEDGSYLANAAHAKVTVTLNDKLVAATLLDDLADMKNDFPARAELAQEVGRALADRQDRLLAQAIAMAALGRRNGNDGTGSTDVYAGEPAAGGIINIDDDTSDSATRDNFLDAIFEAGTKLDAANVPEEDRYIAMHPDYFNFLARNTDVLNRDWGGAGALADRVVPRVAGFQVVKTTNVPTTDLSAGVAGEKNDLDVNFANIDDDATAGDKVMAMCFHKSAAALATAMDIRTEIDYKPEYQGHLIIGSHVMGAAALRRQSAVLICGDE